MCVTPCAKDKNQSGITGPNVDDVQVGEEMIFHNEGEDPKSMFVLGRVMQIPDKE